MGTAAADSDLWRLCEVPIDCRLDGSLLGYPHARTQSVICLPAECRLIAMPSELCHRTQFSATLGDVIAVHAAEAALDMTPPPRCCLFLTSALSPVASPLIAPARSTIPPAKLDSDDFFGALFCVRDSYFECTSNRYWQILACKTGRFVG